MLDNASDKKSQPSDLDTYPGDTADNDTDNTLAVVRPLNEMPRYVAPTHGGVDILKLLTELEDLVENTKRLPGRILLGFDEDKFHMTIMKIRANLPEEMKRASKLARESDRIVEEARENADLMVKNAHSAALTEFEQGKSDAIRLRQETMAECQTMRKTAEQEAQRLREEAQKLGEDLVVKAQAQAAQLVADSEIVHQAQARAHDLQLRAEQEAAGMRRGAEEYARDLLNHLETILGKAASQVQRGRELLEGKE